MNWLIWAIKSLAIGIGAAFFAITVASSIIWIPMVFVYLFGEELGLSILLAIVLWALGASLLNGAWRCD